MRKAAARRLFFLERKRQSRSAGRGEIGPDLFRAARNMFLEDLVSKRRDRPYQAGRSKHWIKMKNRKHGPWTRSDERCETTDQHLYEKYSLQSETRSTTERISFKVRWCMFNGHSERKRLRSEICPRR